ncbi:MAG: hypothetical protein AAB586_01960 [Patescibacteria group bacterium]
MNLPLWYKIVSIIFLILLLPSLLLMAMTITGFVEGDSTIFTIGILPSFVGILYEIMIILTALFKKSWKFFLLTQSVFLIAWLFLWLLLDGRNKLMGVGLVVILSLITIVFNKKLLGSNS